MFHTPLKFYDIKDQHELFLEDEYEIFKQMTTGGKIVKKDEAFVHIKDLSQNEKLRYHLNRRFDGLYDYYKHSPQERL